ncbi:hypothetical protein [Paracoccus ravus]|uniref:hypothetical protein n=1 Tax=Paracoccus ravus TaxID=2447760 RepID=UPI00106EE670|nr:hypothetical protein [Paracoccus ravus]
MTLLSIIERNPLIFVGGLLLGLIVFFELGLLIGRHRRKIIGEGADEGATLVVGSVLSLLAFVLALNLSNATSRQETRMNSGLEEVNAIGTALMQAEAVGGAQAGPITEDLKAYLALRYRFIRAEPHSAELAEVTAATDQLQARIWTSLEQRVAESPTPPVTSLMNALNNAFDATTRVRLAMGYKLPAQLVLLLLVMSILGGATVGYQFGLTNRKGQLAGIVLSILWSTIVTAIIDIGSGRIWTFRTDARAYVWAMEGFDIADQPVVTDSVRPANP